MIMERNDELIDKVIDYIREHPEEWNQSVWGYQAACGTEACFALLMSGYTYNQGFRDPEGRTVSGIPEIASELLGIPERQARLFFYGVTEYNGVEGLEMVVARIRSGHADTEAGCADIRAWLDEDADRKVRAEEDRNSE
jgi:hypothetical protein